jgi:hypothetical protein
VRNAMSEGVRFPGTRSSKDEEWRRIAVAMFHGAALFWIKRSQVRCCHVSDESGIAPASTAFRLSANNNASNSLRDRAGAPRADGTAQEKGAFAPIKPRNDA